MRMKKFGVAGDPTIKQSSSGIFYRNHRDILESRIFQLESELIRQAFKRERNAAE
jgi:hypothetical protein